MLGEMLELGRSTETLHRDVGRYAVESGIDVLVAIHGAASVRLRRPNRPACRAAPRIFSTIPPKPDGWSESWRSRAMRFSSRAPAGFM